MERLGHKFGNDGVCNVSSTYDKYVLTSTLGILDILRGPSQEVSAFRPDSPFRAGMDDNTAVDKP